MNVDHPPQGDNHFADAQAAVHDAFRRAKRVLKDRASKQRGEVKTLHERIERTINQPPEAYMLDWTAPIPRAHTRHMNALTNKSVT